VIIISALVSGALAGLAGAGEVGGVRYQVTSDLSSGYGYAGIVIATLAELNPLGVIPAAFFFAIIFNGAGTMARSTGVPIYLADVIQGVALLTMAAGRLFTVYRLRVVRHACRADHAFPRRFLRGADTHLDAASPCHPWRGLQRARRRPQSRH